jgi:signal transduction histidine kinase
LQVAFTLGGKERRLPPHVELNLYRIAQEALTNVRKHAQAGQVTVALDFSPHSVELTVSDNGRGGVNGDNHSGWGVRGIQERALLLDGELRLASPPGQGTRLAVVVPLAPARSEPDKEPVD